MIRKIFYNGAKDAVVNFVSREYPTLPEKVLIRLTNFFYKFCNYEEEGQKLRPSLIVTNNMDAVIKNVPTAYKLDVFFDKNEVLFEQRLKSLISFCKNEWIVYIWLKEDQVVYGICKTFNSIKEKSIDQLIFETKSIIENEKVSLIFADAISTYAIGLKGTKGNEVTINFSLDNEGLVDYEGVIKRFVSATLTKLKTTKNKINEIKILEENIFKRAFRSINGAICVVIDKDYEDTGLFADGIWLQEPIELSKIFIQTKSYSDVKLNNIAELFMDMLNYDGITIIDNTGKIRAYNVFVSADNSAAKKIVGGARKRAAYSILNTKKKKIIGVYFQSQDGEIFYEEVKK